VIPVAVTFLCLVPFVGKAFHIDDPLFLWSAGQIRKAPFDFYGFDVNWYTTSEPMVEVINHPPLVPYFLAAVTASDRPSETVLHIIFLIPAIAAAAGTYFLAARFCSHPAVAALAAALTPVFLISSTNVMVDTTMLAFWVWAIFFWQCGTDNNSWPKLLTGGVLAAFCALTKYFGISLVVLFFAYSIAKTKKFGLWVLFLLIPAAALFGCELITYKLYGKGVLSTAAAFAVELGWQGRPALPTKVLVGLAFAGGCVLTAVFFARLVWSLRAIAVWFFLTFFLMLVFVFVKKAHLFGVAVTGLAGWGFLLQFCLMAVAGASLLSLAVLDFAGHRDADSLLLMLWLFGTIVFVCLVNWTVNARTVLPIVPAAGILLVRRAERLGGGRQRTLSRRAVLPLVCAAAVSLGLCWADYTWADTQRTAAGDFAKRFNDYKGQLWFQGHWGFQYYMEQNGFKAFDFKADKTKKGDILVIPSNNCFTKFLPEQKVSFVDSLRYRSGRFLATMDRFCGAGFYSDLMGPMPFAIGPVGPEQYYIFVFN